MVPPAPMTKQNCELLVVGMLLLYLVPVLKKTHQENGSCCQPTRLKTILRWLRMNVLTFIV